MQPLPRLQPDPYELRLRAEDTATPLFVRNGAGTYFESNPEKKERAPKKKKMALGTQRGDSLARYLQTSQLRRGDWARAKNFILAGDKKTSLKIAARAYRTGALTVHPDKGASAANIHELKEAAE